MPDNNKIFNTPFKVVEATPSIYSRPDVRKGDIPNNNRFPEYLTDVSYQENEDIHGRTQTTGDKWANAAVKFGGLTATTFANSTVGLVKGIQEWSTTGQFHRLWGNDVTKAMDESMKQMENDYANYYTNAETERSWWKNLGTANFWANDFFKNMGFAAGAALSGGVYNLGAKMTGKLLANLILKGSKLLTTEGAAATLLGAREINATVAATERLNKFGKLVNKIDEALPAIAKTGKFVNQNGRRFIVSTLSAAGESSMEALQTSNTMRDKYIQEYYEKHGLLPEGEELEKINDLANKAGNMTFGMNMTLLTATNYIQFPHLFGGSFSKGGKILNRFERNAEGAAQAVNRKGFRRVLETVHRPLRTLISPSEAFEEFSQTAIQHGAENYFSKAKEGENPSFLLDAVFEGYKYAATSDEGQQSAFIGGLTGGVMEYAGGVREGLSKKKGFSSFVPEAYRDSAEAKKNTSKAVNEINNSPQIKDLMTSLRRGEVIAKEQEEAQKSGDKLQARDLEQDYLINYIYPKIKWGKLDFVLEDIEAARERLETPQGLSGMKSEGLLDESDTKESVLKRLKNIESVAKQMDALHDNLYTRYGNATDKKGNILYTDEVVEKLVYSAMKRKDYQERIDEISLQLVTPIELNKYYEKLYSGTLSQDDIDELFKEIDDNNALDVIQKEDTKLKFLDILELEKRKSLANLEYSRIVLNPKSSQTLPKYRTKYARNTSYDKSSDPSSSFERSKEDLVNEYGEGEKNIHETLDKIIASKHATPAEKFLAEKLKGFFEDDEMLFLNDSLLTGTSDLIDGVLHINYEDHSADYITDSKSVIEHTIITDLLKMLLIEAIDPSSYKYNKKFKEEMENIFKFIKDSYKESFPENVPMYAFRSLLQFISESLTNTHLQSFIAQIETTKEYKGAAREFKDIVKDYLSEAFPELKTTQALDRTLDLVLNNLNVSAEERRNTAKKEAEQRKSTENTLNAYNNDETITHEGDVVDFSHDNNKKDLETGLASSRTPSSRMEDKPGRDFISRFDFWGRRFNFFNFKLKTGKIQGGSLKVLPITYETQKQYGLNIIPASYINLEGVEIFNTGEKRNDASAAIVLAYVVENEYGGVSFVDINGEILKNPSGENIVFTYLEAASKDNTGDTKDKERFVSKHLTEEEANILYKGAIERRKAILDGEAKLFSFRLSKGVVLKRPAANTFTSVAQAEFVKEGQITNSHIHVPFNKETTKLVLGKPYMRVGNSLVPLHTQLLGESNASNVADILIYRAAQLEQNFKGYVNTPKEKKIAEILDWYLRGILLYKKVNSSSAVYIEKGSLHIGGRVFPLNTLGQNRELLISLLKGIRANVNLTLLRKEDKPFIEPKIEGGSLVLDRVWNNYASFLTGSKHKKGTITSFRGEEHIPVKTDAIAPVKDNKVKSDIKEPTLDSIYLVLEDFLSNDVKPLKREVKETQEEAAIEKETPTQETSFSEEAPKPNDNIGPKEFTVEIIIGKDLYVYNIETGKVMIFPENKERNPFRLWVQQEDFVITRIMAEVDWLPGSALHSIASHLRKKAIEWIETLSPEVSSRALEAFATTKEDNSAWGVPSQIIEYNKEGGIIREERLRTEENGTEEEESEEKESEEKESEEKESGEKVVAEILAINEKIEVAREDIIRLEEEIKSLEELYTSLNKNDKAKNTKERNKKKSIVAETESYIEKLEKELEEKAASSEKAEKDTKEIKTDKREDEEDVDDDNPFSSHNRVVVDIRPDYELEDLEEFKKYASEVVPQAIIKEVHQLIRTTGGYAWGQTVGNIITLFAKAEKGTGYHEIFEFIYNAILDENEQKHLVSLFNKRKGTFIDRETQKEVKFSEATPHQAKEQMAEEFRGYKLSGKLSEKSTKSLFDRIIELINWLLRKPSLNTIFKRIDSGYYKKSVPVLSQKKNNSLALNASYKHELFQGMTWFIGVELAESGKDVRDVVKNEAEVIAMYRRLYDYLDVYYSTGDTDNLNNIHNNKSFLPYVSKEEREEEILLLKRKWETAKKVWNTLVEEHVTFIRSFGVDIDSFPSEEELQEEREDKTSFRDFIKDSFESDPFGLTPNILKFLYSTLTVKDEDYFTSFDSKVYDRLSSIGLPILASTSRTYFKVLKELANTKSAKEMQEKLKEISVQYPSLSRIYKRIFPKEDPASWNKNEWIKALVFFTSHSVQSPEFFFYQIKEEGGAIRDANKDTIDENSILKWMSALQSDSSLAIEGEDGAVVYKKGSIKREGLPSTEEDFLSFLRDVHFPISKATFRRIMLSPEREHFLEDVKTVAQRFISGDSFEISMNGLDVWTDVRRVMRVMDKYSDVDIPSMHTTLDGEEVNQYIQKSTTQRVLNKLLGIKGKITEDMEDMPIEEIIAQVYPELSYYLSDPFSKNSEFLKTLHNNVKYPFGIYEGILNKNDKRPIDIISEEERVFLQAVNNSKGYIYFYIPADSKREWTIDMSAMFENIISVNNTLKGYLESEMLTVLSFEDRAFIEELNKKVLNGKGESTVVGKRLRFFKDILPVELVVLAEEAANTSEEAIQDFLEKYDAAVETALDAYIEKEMSSLYHYLVNNAFIKFDSFIKRKDAIYAENAYTVKAISETALTKEQMKDFLYNAVTNNIIGTIELYKIFFSDPANYKDDVKRLKSLQVGTYETINGEDIGFNFHAREVFNTITFEGNSLTLLPTDVGYIHFSPTVKTLTVNHGDSPTTSTKSPTFEANYEFAINYYKSIGYTEEQAIEKAEVIKNYLTINTMDAQSLMLDTVAVEYILKSSPQEWDKEREETHNILMARGRLKMYEEGILKEEDYRKELKEMDEKLSKKETSASLFIFKPLSMGAQARGDFHVMNMQKTATPTLYYSLLPDNSPIKELYIFMYKNHIGLIGPKSYNKVGKIKNPPLLYNPKTQRLNTEELEQKVSSNMVEVPWEYFNKIVETSGEKRKQTRGSQAHAIIPYMNLFNEGVAVDEEVEKQVKKYHENLQEYAEISYKGLLDRLGITEDEDGYRIYDHDLLVQFIIEEANKKDLPRNVIDSLGLKYDEESDSYVFENSLESLPHYEVIRNILWTAANNAIVEVKLKGGPKIQVSFDLWEQNGKEAVYLKDNVWTKVTDDNFEEAASSPSFRYASSELKFYTPKEPWIEVKLPNHFREELKKHYIDISDEELIKKLNTKEGKKLLSAIGFRIPTQALNSVDNIRIKGFLPKEYGDMVMVPLEMTGKSGSDFDVDKLNIYLRNFYIIGEEIFYTKFFENKEEHEAFYLEVFKENLKNRRERAEKSYKHLKNLEGGLFRVVFGSFAIRDGKLVENRKSIEKWKGILRKQFPDAKNAEEISARIKALLSRREKQLENLNNIDLQTIEMWNFIDSKRKESLENSYSDSLEFFLTHPANYINLITPNSAEDMEELSNEIFKMVGGAAEETVTGINYASRLSIVATAISRQRNLAAKSGVAISAVHQKTTALRQATATHLSLSPLSLEEEDSKYLVRYEKHSPFIRLRNNAYRAQTNTYSLSHTKNIEGENISNINSKAIDGQVDAVNKPWAGRMNINNETLPIFLFLQGTIGASPKDVGLFMNQPVIYAYYKIKRLNKVGRSFSDERYKDDEEIRREIISQLNVDGGLALKWKEDDFTEEELKKAILSFSLKGSLKKLSLKERQLQLYVLDEFLKYSLYANHLRKYTDAVKWDTARYNSVYTFFIKESLVNGAEKSLISSAKKTNEGTFLEGSVRQPIINIHKAYSQIFKLSSGKYLNVLAPIINLYTSANVSLSEEDRKSILRRAEMMLVSYIAQVKGGLNQYIVNLFLSNTAIVNEMLELKKNLKGDILNNFALQSLSPIVQNNFTWGAPKNIGLFVKMKNTSEKNLLTDSFEEMRDNPLTADFYNNLVLATMLQSGSINSRFSFSSFIPFIDFSSVVKTLLEEATEDDFINYLDAFYKNSWEDDKIVPVVKRFKMIKIKGGSVLAVENPRFTVYDYLSFQEDYTDFESLYDLLEMRGTVTKYLVRKVRDAFGKPFSYEYEGATAFLYKLVNPWGDGRYLQEFYDVPSVSKVRKNRPITEISDAEIIASFPKISPLPVKEEEESVIRHVAVKEGGFKINGVTGFRIHVAATNKVIQNKEVFKSMQSSGLISFEKETPLAYKSQYKEEGLPVNPVTYIKGNVYNIAEDITNENKEAVLEEVIKALDKGAAVFLDSYKFLKYSSMNESHEWLYNQLSALKYTEQETFNSNVSLWYREGAKDTTEYDMLGESLKKILLKNKKITTSQLANLSNTFYLREFYKKLEDAEIIVTEDFKGIEQKNALYNYKEEKIYINKSVLKNISPEQLLNLVNHELMHKMLDENYHKGKAYRKKDGIDDTLFRKSALGVELLKFINAIDLGVASKYTKNLIEEIKSGKKPLEELVASAFQYDNFLQKDLLNQKVAGEKTKSFWQHLVDILVRFTTKHKNMMDVLADILNNNVKVKVDSNSGVLSIDQYKESDFQKNIAFTAKGVKRHLKVMWDGKVIDRDSGKVLSPSSDATIINKALVLSKLFSFEVVKDKTTGNSYIVTANNKVFTQQDAIEVKNPEARKHILEMSLINSIFKNSKEFSEAEKERVIKSVTEAYKINREKALIYLNDALYKDYENSVEKIKECFL